MTHFQGTLLGGGYSTADVYSGGQVGRGEGNPFGGGFGVMLYKRLVEVVDSGALVITKAPCRVSLIHLRPLSSSRSQFTSTVSPVRYQIFKPV